MLGQHADLNIPVRTAQNPQFAELLDLVKPVSQVLMRHDLFPPNVPRRRTMTRLVVLFNFHRPISRSLRTRSALIGRWRWAIFSPTSRYFPAAIRRAFSISSTRQLPSE